MCYDAAMSRIDVHHHFVPPSYLRRERERVLAAMALNPEILTEWTPARAVEELDRHDIARALVSISTPGIWFGEPEAARTLARECNEYAAQMARDHPGRFGNFAAIPLPDVEGSLREIAHAYDVLGADGVGILTSYDDRWPGDAAFAPVFDELNRRKAKVFVHPTMSCCGNVFPGISKPIIEFPTDTARTVASLALSGTMARFPDVTFIFSHGGGSLPSIVQRLAIPVSEMKPEERAKRLPRGLDYELKRQYYDLASVGSSPPGMAAVLKLWPITQLTYGSDVPFGSSVGIAEGITKLGLADADLKLIQRGNAARLFPHLD